MFKTLKAFQRYYTIYMKFYMAGIVLGQFEVECLWASVTKDEPYNENKTINVIITTIAIQTGSTIIEQILMIKNLRSLLGTMFP